MVLVVLYEIYQSCPNHSIQWLVVMATKRLTLQKIFKNHLLRSCTGDKAESLQNVLSISFYKITVFDAVAQALWFLWQLEVPVDLWWEKWKSHCRYFCWVVLYQTYKFCPRLSMWSVVMATATERLILRKIKKNQLLGNHAGDKAENLQKCSEH